jgi:hypothetical protein
VATVDTQRTIVANLFDYTEIDAIASDYVGGNVVLSAFSMTLALHALAVMEERTNWCEMSDIEWDVLEALIADAICDVTCDI